ncbi:MULTISPECIES: hypothetical protein [Colwellia]|jgi:fatty acid desaturase|uniref:DUF4870 domain-containing protein n=1 Tax=Colwellia psychrerythraea (strain 34H / ATCC BAA-681) TaxID=167879 RepID=Q47ZP3_COLP3|nr:MULTISPECIES: hypothetical protein [Colwellia]AAZ26375.1 hypothetical protein CPS_3028 [Colwellia psychrerythraea 34H]PKH87274.1 hypothetical protein CXF79_11350 [Colwellia sp. Bg11-28]
MVLPQTDTITAVDKQQIKQASNAALASILNLTFLPGIAFIWLILAIKNMPPNSISHYHAKLGIKLNIIAFIALGVVSVLMVILGGFESAWTWVYVITYFTFVHTTFIILAVWALTRAWSGLKLR